MRIGVPKEIKVLENRVGLVPGSVREAVAPTLMAYRAVEGDPTVCLPGPSLPADTTKSVL